MEIQIKSVVVGGKAENKDDLQMRYKVTFRSDGKVQNVLKLNPCDDRSQF